MRRPVKNRHVVKGDLHHDDKDISKFINYIMLNGKKTVAQKIVYGAFDIIKDKTGNVLSYIKENIDCLGISKNKIYGRKKSQEFLNKLKSNNMCIHVYTFNKENISRGFKTLDEEILYFKENLKVNGIFKD